MPQNNPTTVTIPDVGDVDFPASMSQEQINVAAKKLYQDKHQKKELAPSVPTESDFMRGYKAVGQEIKAPFQGAANLAQQLSRALGKGGPSEVIRQIKSGEIGSPPTGTVTGALKAALAPLNPVAIKRTPEGDVDVPASVGGTIGRLGVMVGIPEAREGGAEAAAKVGKEAAEALRTIARNLTHAGERQTKQLVADTVKDNEAAIKDAAKATDKNKQRATDINTRRQDAFQERKATHAAKAAQITEANRVAQADYEKAKTDYEQTVKDATETGTRRGELAREVQQQGVRMLNRVRQVQEAAKAKLDTQFNQVREKVGTTPVDRADLANDANEAQKFIQGTTEVPKVFKDIEGKATEGLKALGGGRGVMDEGLKPGHPVYDRLIETGIIEPPKTATYNDLQGYVSEIGRELSKGTLAGDVFQAYKALQEKLLDRMEKIASDAGMGSTLKKARSGYRDYMQTFFEPSGPEASALAKALQERLPENAIPHLSGTKDVRDIRTNLAKFDPAIAGQGGAAQLYDNYLKSLREYKGLPKSTPAPKSLQPPVAPTPKTIPPAPRAKPPVVGKTVEPEITKIGTDELIASKKAAIKQEVRSADRFGTWIIPMTMMHGLLGAVTLNAEVALSALADIPLYLASREAFARVLEKPGVQDWIAHPSTKDIQELMKLPPQYRGVMQQQVGKLISTAQAEGRTISPELLGFVGGQGALAPRKNPTDEWSQQ